MCGITGYPKYCSRACGMQPKWKRGCDCPRIGTEHQQFMLINVNKVNHGLSTGYQTGEALLVLVQVPYQDQERCFQTKMFSFKVKKQLLQTFCSKLFHLFPYSSVHLSVLYHQNSSAKGLLNVAAPGLTALVSPGSCQILLLGFGLPVIIQ